jgi:hypothetical protein
MEQNMQRFLAVGRVLLVLGGVLLALGAGLQAVTADGDFSSQATTSPFVVSAALRLVGAIALMVGMTALFLTICDRAGSLGLVAYLLVVVNLMLQAGWMFSDLFITGAIASHAPEILNGDADSARMSAGFMVAWFLNAAFILMGIAVLRSRVYSRVVGLCVLGMGVVTLIPLPMDGPAFEVVIGALAAVAGVVAIRGATQDGESDRHAREVGEHVEGVSTSLAQ